MLLAILFAYYGYKKGNDSGRNGVLWGFIALAVFIVSQLVVGLLLGVAVGIGVVAFGWSDTVFDDFDILFRIVGIVAGIIGGYFVLKYLDRLPPDETYNAPPPPPTFSG
jgi:ABC-type Co2+ transport system permease subunit